MNRSWRRQGANYGRSIVFIVCCIILKYQKKTKQTQSVRVSCSRAFCPSIPASRTRRGRGFLIFARGQADLPPLDVTSFCVRNITRNIPEWKRDPSVTAAHTHCVQVRAL